MIRSALHLISVYKLPVSYSELRIRSYANNFTHTAVRALSLRFKISRHWGLSQSCKSGRAFRVRFGPRVVNRPTSSGPNPKIQCWALPQTGPQVRKSANCGLKVLVCGFANRFLTANICGKKIEIYRKSANQQHHWDCFCNFQKNTFLRFNASTDLGRCISNVQHLSPRSSAVERLFPKGRRCCYSYSKMSWLKVNKLPTACFCEGKLRLFVVAKRLHKTTLMTCPARLVDK